MIILGLHFRLVLAVREKSSLEVLWQKFLELIVNHLVSFGFSFVEMRAEFGLRVLNELIVNQSFDGRNKLIRFTISYWLN